MNREYEMSDRVDSASRLIQARPADVYRAFAEPGAMERWLPPGNMLGEMLHFDFREGGSFRLRLSYQDPAANPGKSGDGADESEVRLIRLEAGSYIEQEVVFKSEDPAFSGKMTMTWRFEPQASGTLVTVRAFNVPAGILPEDHQAGMTDSLNNLASFLENT